MTTQVPLTSSSSNAAEMLRDTERTRLRALVDADLTQAELLHAFDFQLITPRGLALSKTEYFGAIQSGRIKYLFWEPSRIAVRLYEEVAVIRYRAQLEVVFDSHKIPRSEYWHTDTYEVREERWQVVWSQATATM